MISPYKYQASFFFLIAPHSYTFSLNRLYRSSAQTNQRIYFDLDPHGRHLGTGGQDGLVHIYDLQTGQWISGFQAAADTVNGFAFHPSLPMAVSSSGHRRFQVPDDEDDNLPLTDDENCVSIWSFSCGSTIETGDIDVPSPLDPL
ncbi:Telomerase Cajal body protein 1 [Linum perenne]